MRKYWEFASHIFSLTRRLKDVHVQEHKWAGTKAVKDYERPVISPCLQGRLLAGDTRGSWVRDKGLLQPRGSGSFLFTLLLLNPQTPEGRCREAQVAAARTLGLEHRWKPSNWEALQSFRSWIMFVCLLSFHSFKEALSQPDLSFAPEEDIIFIILVKKLICSPLPRERLPLSSKDVCRCKLLQVMWKFHGQLSPNKEDNYKIKNNF